jgi:hypothetical protein
MSRDVEPMKVVSSFPCSFKSFDSFELTLQELLIVAGSKSLVRMFSSCCSLNTYRTLVTIVNPAIFRIVFWYILYVNSCLSRSN